MQTNSEETVSISSLTATTPMITTTLSTTTDFTLSSTTCPSTPSDFTTDIFKEDTTDISFPTTGDHPNIQSTRIDAHDTTQEGSPLSTTMQTISSSENATTANKTCHNPILDIHQRALSFRTPAVLKRNDLITLIGITSLNCNIMLSNQKEWLIFKLSETNGNAVQQIMVMNNPTFNNAELVLQPNSLDYGVYQIVYSVTMLIADKTVAYNSRIDTFLKIVPSGLVISALYMSQSNGASTIDITRGTQQTIDFNPFLNSYDIDEIVSVNSLQFKYYCQLVANGVSQGSQIDLKLYKADNSSLGANQTCFISPDGYEFEGSSGNLLRINNGSLKYAANSVYEILVATNYSNTVYAQKVRIHIVNANSVPIILLK